MDPITTAIIAALAVGVAGGATEVSKKAIVDTYDALKAVLKRKFGDSGDLVQAVEQLEKKPDSKSRQDVVKEEVEAANAHQDSELQQLARQLIEALENTHEGKQILSKYKIDARGAQVGVIGDKAKVEGGIHFTSQPPEGN